MSLYKILIIEDNPGDLVLIQDYLDDYFRSYNQTSASTFAKAEKILSAKKDYFDIILLDLSLPDNDGMPLLNEIVKLADSTPIVILTGYANITFGSLTLNHGASDYLLKDELSPFSLYKSIIHNIERNRHVKEIEKSRKRFSDLFQLNPQPLILYDVESMSINKVNDAACNLYGYTMEEFSELSLADIRPKEEIPILQSEFERIKQSNKIFETYKGTFLHKKKNGQVFTVEIYSNPASQTNTHERVSLINDVSEKVKHLEKIENQNKRLKEITWIQSHVVRAPLARIMGLIGLLSDKKVPADHEEKDFLLNNINISAQELDKIITDITQKASELNS